MNPGNDWDWTGACPGMRTPCEVYVSGCTLTITYSGGMTMGMPTGGLVTGDQVEFNNAGSVTGCTGTVNDPDNITGTCDGNCGYTLSR